MDWIKCSFQVCGIFLEESHDTTAELLKEALWMMPLKLGNTLLEFI